MFGKSKARGEFEAAFKAGNEALMQKILGENPWLLAEWESKMDGSTSGVQQVVMAALGVMEDEIQGPVPIDEISFSLRVDFKTKKDDAEISRILTESESLGLCKKIQNGYQLTPQGGKICDVYLNSHAA
jgi:hypothetical protein